MDKQKINSQQYDHPGYGAGEGDVERYEYKCPCGKGSIIEEHDNAPGFRDHSVYFNCKECDAKFNLDTSKGTRDWVVVPK